MSSSNFGRLTLEDVTSGATCTSSSSNVDLSHAGLIPISGTTTGSTVYQGPSSYLGCF